MLSELSVQRLGTCHPDLQRLVFAVAKLDNIAVLCGHRGEAEQVAAYHDGRSRLTWPQSKHNSLPSRAVDLARVPIDWRDTHGFCTLADVVKAQAAELGIKIVWGGDWKGLKDLDHFQLA